MERNTSLLLKSVASVGWAEQGRAAASRLGVFVVSILLEGNVLFFPQQTLREMLLRGINEKCVWAMGQSVVRAA